MPHVHYHFHRAAATQTRDAGPAHDPSNGQFTSGSGGGAAKPAASASNPHGLPDDVRARLAKMAPKITAQQQPVNKTAGPTKGSTLGPDMPGFKIPAPTTKPTKSQPTLKDLQDHADEAERQYNSYRKQHGNTEQASALRQAWQEAHRKAVSATLAEHTKPYTPPPR